MNKYNIQTDETTHIPGMKAGSGGGRSIELVSIRAEDIDSVGGFRFTDSSYDSLWHPVIWTNTDIFFGQRKKYFNGPDSGYQVVLFDWLGIDEGLIFFPYACMAWLGIGDGSEPSPKDCTSGVTYLYKASFPHDETFMVISKKLKKFIKIYEMLEWGSYPNDEDWSQLEVLTPVFDYEKTKNQILRFFEEEGIPGGPELFD